MNEDPVRPSSFCSKTGVDPSPDGGGGGGGVNVGGGGGVGGVYVKNWPSGEYGIYIYIRVNVH